MKLLKFLSVILFFPLVILVWFIAVYIDTLDNISRNIWEKESIFPLTEEYEEYIISCLTFKVLDDSNTLSIETQQIGNNKMNAQNRLIKHYEEMLEKVIGFYGDSPRHVDYVKHAENELQAVKDGRTW